MFILICRSTVVRESNLDMFDDPRATFKLHDDFETDTVK